MPLSDEIEHYSLGNESIERSFTDERFWLYVFSGNDLAGSILPSPLQSRGIGSAMQCPKETSFVCFHPTCQEAILKRVVWPPWKEIRQLLTHSLLFSIKNLPKGKWRQTKRKTVIMYTRLLGKNPALFSPPIINFHSWPKKKMKKPSVHPSCQLQ